MNIKALIATLVLGSSTLAVVAPALASADVRDHRTDSSFVVQGQLTAQADIHAKGWTDRVDHRRMLPPVYVPQPVTLASSARINGRDIIRVSDTRAFTKLELKSTSGRTQLDKVMIQFGNGQTQVINCEKQLSGQESFSIDLTGNARNIKKIVLVGKSGRRASVDVIAV